MIKMDTFLTKINLFTLNMFLFELKNQNLLAGFLQIGQSEWTEIQSLIQARQNSWPHPNSCGCCAFSKHMEHVLSSQSIFSSLLISSSETSVDL